METPAQQTHIAALEKKVKGKQSVRQQIMTEEEMELNPQVNQNKRKAAKQSKKEVCPNPVRYSDAFIF